MVDVDLNKAFNFAADALGIGSNSYARGLSEAAKRLADTIDKTIHNTYIDSGWVENQKNNPNPRVIVTQSPELIVLVKKRIFSSLQENYPIDKMDIDERHFIAATKTLFENKCKQIAAYERLTKAEKMVRSTDFVSPGLAQFIVEAVDSADTALYGGGLFGKSVNAGVDWFASKIYKNYHEVINRIRDLMYQNGYSTTTKWITGSKTNTNTYIGRGTGVIELTLVNSFNCTNSIKFGGGSASMSVLDPYRLFAIEEADIERALLESADNSYSFFNGLAASLRSETEVLIANLNGMRESRGASPISVHVNPYSRLYNRVIITLDKYGLELTSPDGTGLRSDICPTNRDDISTAKEVFRNLILKVRHTYKDGFGVEKISESGPASYDVADFELFKIDKSSIQYKGNDGKLYKKTFYSLSGGASNSSPQSERELLQVIYDNMTQVVAMEEKDYTDLMQYSDATNEVRRMMRQNYLGKQIIQPMDTVTAFITSNTIDDNVVTSGIKATFFNDGQVAKGLGSAIEKIGGLGSGFIAEGIEKAGKEISASQLDFRNIPMLMGGGNPVGALNKNIGDLKELWGGVFGGKDSKNWALEAERNMLAGPDFPMYLYLSLRQYFGSTEFGTCVFNGVVQRVTEDYSAGSGYTVSVECKDNTFYFEQGMFQEQPATYQFNGHLYDPLTPFDLEFDEATGKANFDSNFKLLDENIALIKSGALKYKYGRFVNEKITLNNLSSPDLEEISVPDGIDKQANYKSLSLQAKTATNRDLVRRVFYNPDGFVYKWKKGIGTAWMNSNPRGGVGQALVEDMNKNQVAQVIRADPFAGQDIVNVISLLVTGEPYNLSTFIDAALTSGILSNNYTNRPNDFFDNISKLVRKQNRIWGNFIPFKRFNIDTKLFAELMTSQLTLKSQSKKISDLQTERAKLMNKLAELDCSFTTPDNLLALSTIKYIDVGRAFNAANTQTINVSTQPSVALVQKILDLDGQIQIAQQKILESISTDYANKGLRIMGADDTFMGAYEGSSNVGDTRIAASSASQRLARRQNFITQRRLWQVKSNTDKNLFIVCDEYDHDVDIQAIAQNLSDFQFVNSTWQKTGDRIVTLAKNMGMECFANTQGHIEIRIPQYNRVPSSLFFDMIRKKRKYGIQVYPTFLEKTFMNRLDSIFDEIEVIEDWIRLYSTLLGYYTDEKASEFLSGGIDSTKVAPIGGSATPVSGTKFVFVTDEGTGKMSSVRAAVAQINTDFTNSYEDPDTGFLNVSITTNETEDFFTRNTKEGLPGKRFNWFSQVYARTAETSVDAENVVATAFALNESQVIKQVGAFQQVARGTYNNFDIIKQIANVEKAIQNSGSYINLSDFQESKVLVKPILDRLSQKLGTSLDQKQFVTAAFSSSTSKFISPLDIFNMEKKISEYVSKRYRAILSATNLINNLDQVARFNSPDSTALSGLLMPNLFPGSEIPSFISHMIEDESEDDYGYGAGKRFVVQPKDVVKVSYGEQSPEFTSVTVKGAEEGGLVGGQGFNIGSGMEIRTVWATDYDLWRMYGFKDSTPKYMPMLSNVETQIAPYAIFLLNQQRAGLLHASLTRTGNEFVQPGEVYYMKDRGLLFYCEDVRHSFSYGGSFTTTMTLTYGHTVGEYIPTPLDVIGKSLYRGHHTNVGSYRMSHPAGANVSSDEVHLGSLAFDFRAAGTSEVDDEKMSQLMVGGGKYGERNKNTLVDILYKLRNIIDNPVSAKGDNKLAMVSVRTYRFNTNKSVYVKNIQNAAEFIVSLLMNPQSLMGQAKGTGKGEEDLSPLTKVPKSKFLGGMDDPGLGLTDIIGTQRIVDLGANNKAQSDWGSFATVRTVSGQAISLAKELANDSGFFQNLYEGTVSTLNFLRASFRSKSGLDAAAEEEANVSANKLRTALAGGVIDIWIEYVVPDNDLKSQITTYDNQNKETTKPEISPVEEFYERLNDATGQPMNDKELTISIVVKTP